MDANEHEWFSPEGLAGWVGVPVATVYQWRHKGTGPRGYRIGKHVRFRRSDVEAWLEAQADERQDDASVSFLRSQCTASQEVIEHIARGGDIG